MKAVILAAGVGSRIRPLTDRSHKSLLPVKGITILERMLINIEAVGIKDIVIVTGYLADQIISVVKKTFPKLNISFVHNNRYEFTNTGYSLLLTKEYVNNSDFIKFDADVVFDASVLKNLLDNKNPNCLCIDTNINLDKEEVKVTLTEEGAVKAVSKKLDPINSHGESIGIEKISKKAGAILFDELNRLMMDSKNHQEYYDDSYTTLVNKDVPFHAVNITGHRWVEIDTHDDYHRANSIF